MILLLLWPIDWQTERV